MCLFQDVYEILRILSSEVWKTWRCLCTLPLVEHPAARVFAQPAAVWATLSQG